ncbi:hypothetical protein A0H81_07413 [Grifola frondosa]|uniref:Small secreted protein n=1 Tax=Grifola frondosa TaxID=5627 RepID=A0A1C7M6N6_GRIFR|nr:hypothetical protein A0H81_07413 [Grifola frondosa]
MVRIAAFAVVVPAFAELVFAAPLHLSRRAFTLQDYADFQISDGTAGNAQADAAAVFLTPFDGVDLATVDSTTLSAKTMREAAETAETAQFDPAIDAATGAAATALQNGKIKNKVLKLTGEVQTLNIEIAQAKASNEDTSDLETQLAAEQTKLNTNIALDTKAAGQASQGVTGGTTNEAAASASSSSSSSVSKTKTKAVRATTAAAAASTPASGTADGSSFTFAVQAYADFQISDGTAGNAAAQANAVFVDPLNGLDLSTLDDSVATNMNTMREAAETAETAQFDPAIDAATGAAATALQNGKIKNKVLKLTGEVQVLNIKIAKAQAAGEDTSDLESQLADEQTKLTTNIATDTKNVGAASKGVV